MHTINIKLDNPPADVAVANLQQEIELCSLAKIDVIKVIHGYGSHGKGGLIKTEIKKLLKTLKAKKKIIDFIPGEHFSQSLKYYKKLVEVYPEIILDSDLYPPNFGLTLVILKLGGFGNI